MRWCSSNIDHVSNDCTPSASFSEATVVLPPRDALIREEERDLGGGGGTLGTHCSNRSRCYK